MKVVQAKALHRKLNILEVGRVRTPVQPISEVMYVGRLDVGMLTYVMVIPQHAHWHMGWYLWKLLQNVAEGPLLSDVKYHDLLITVLVHVQEFSLQGHLKLCFQGVVSHHQFITPPFATSLVNYTPELNFYDTNSGFIVPVDTDDLVFLCEDELLHKVLALQSVPQHYLVCVPVFFNHYLHFVLYSLGKVHLQYLVDGLQPCRGVLPEVWSLL